jgi:hypothetical protein
MVMKKLVTSGVVSVAALILSTGPVQASMYRDLTTAGASATINGGLFTTASRSSCSGCTLDEFLQIKSCQTTQQAYNTDAGQVLDSGTLKEFNHSLQLSDIPVVTVDGVKYREFLLNVNESPCNPQISLDSLQIYLRTSGNYNGSVVNLGTPIWSLDTRSVDWWILLDSRLNSGCQGIDMFAYIPDSLFGTCSDKYVYLYSKFGCNKPADGCYEEWYVRKCPPPVVPVPAGVILGVLGLSVAGWRLRRYA